MRGLFVLMTGLFLSPLLIQSFSSASLSPENETLRPMEELLYQRAVLEAASDTDLAHFDQELEDKSFDLFTSSSYHRLLAQRSMIESIEHQIMDSQDLRAQMELSMIKKDWKSYIKNSNFQASNKQLTSFSDQVTEEISQIQRDLSNHLLHLSGGSFKNIDGNGFSSGRWALTFDDGPHNSRTLAVLNNLKTYGFTATFFQLAKLAKRLPSVTQQLVNSGMEIANHSYSHPNMAKLGLSSLETQIYTSSDVIEGVSKRPLRFFRLPYGSGQTRSLIQNLLSNRNLIHVAWNVDSLDWKDRNSQSIFNRVKRQMARQKGGVILFHDIHAQSVKASQLLMQAVRSGEISGDLMSVGEALR